LNIFEAILLGIIQGLSEFLPISSTGHLTVAGKLMNLISTEHPEQWTAFIAVIQLGTMLAVLVYFWKDLFNIIKDFANYNLIKPARYSQQNVNSKLGWLIIIGTIPVVIIGLAFKDAIEGALTKNLYVISGSLIILALILALAEKTAKFRKDVEHITIFDSIIIGIAQALSLIPGSSRSGTTITAGLFCGLKREVTARFSFLLSIPAVALSGLYELYSERQSLLNENTLSLIIATVVSGIVGYLSIAFLLNFLKTRSNLIFIIYRVLLGLLILFLLYTGVLHNI
jgi:undecaprenyl-diphosphatase